MYSLWIPALSVQTPILPIDITAIIGVVMGSMIVLIPIAGLTARFALKPIAEAVARMRQGQGTNRELQLVEQRLALMEKQLSNLETDVKEIGDKADFDHRLAAGPEE